MTEIQRLIWTLSMPACAYETSDQHKEMSVARQARDVSDTLDLISCFRERDPFVHNSSLFNIANGMTAQEAVNVEKAKEIGDSIIASMVGEPVEEFTFRKANQAVTLGTRSTVKVKGETVKVDPHLIFQRLIAVGEHWDDLPSLFKCELCTHPLALFDSSSLPLEANKPGLADALWKAMKGSPQREPSGRVQYIIDGGALLHRIPWQRGSTYNSVCQLYVRHVTQKYGAAVIVFDGYKDEPTTKDVTHLRRTGACAGVTVHFTGEMIMQSKKDEFLNNSVNKQRFILFLSDKLERAGCHVDHAKHDADVLIIQTAVASARNKDTVVIGDDRLAGPPTSLC